MNIEHREQTPQPGVQGHRIEHNEYVVDIIWKDGTRTTSHFPEDGFEIADPKTHAVLGKIKGKKVLETLTREAANYNFGDLDWRNFLNHSNNGSNGKS